MSEYTPSPDASAGQAGWAVAQPDGRLVTADVRFAELTGVATPAALVGRRWPDLVAQRSAASLDEALRAVAAGRGWRGALELEAGPAPARLELSLSVAPAPDGGEGTVAVLRAMQPARLLSAEAVDPLARVVTLEAVAESRSAEAAARAVLQELQHALPFDWAVVLRLDAEHAAVVTAYPSPMAGLAGGQAWSPLGADERALLRSGAPSLSGGLQPEDEGGSPLDRLVAFGMRSALRVPLYSGSDVVGCVLLYDRAREAFGPDDGLRAEELVRPLGRRLAELPSAAAPPTEWVGEPPPPESLDVIEEARREPDVAPLEPQPGGEQPPPATAEAPPIEEAPAAPEQPRALADAGRLGAIGEFVTGVAHELNSPLTAIAGYAQMLPSLPEDERAAALGTIEREALRLGRIVQNLLYFSRQQPPRRERVDLNGLLRRVAEVRGEELAAGGLTLDLRLGAVPSVTGDEYQLEQVFLNLVSNAEEAMHPGGGRLVVTTAATGDLAHVTFTDSGPGIAPEVLTRVFDPFFTTGEVGEGAGLGLSIAYGIVSEHGGRLWAESPTGGGARFVVELPLGQASAPATRVPAEEVSAAPATPRVLVALADRPLRSLLEEILEEAGYETATAESPEAAFRAVGERPVSLVIGEAGSAALEVHRNAGALWPGSAPRAVLIVGHDEELPSDLGLEAGVALLRKPFDVEALLATVERLLQQAARG